MGAESCGGSLAFGHGDLFFGWREDQVDQVPACWIRQAVTVHRDLDRRLNQLTTFSRLFYSDEAPCQICPFCDFREC